MDIYSKTKRSAIMRAVRSKNTAPEMMLAKVLRSMRLSFRRNARALAGRPDFFLPEQGIAIFVNGCFWHQHKGCERARLPKSNREFWLGKLHRNVERDLRTARTLRRQGLSVLTVWECETSSHENVMKQLRAKLRRLSLTRPLERRGRAM